MICYLCGSEIQDNSIYCPECGAKQPEIYVAPMQPQYFVNSESPVKPEQQYDNFVLQVPETPKKKKNKISTKIILISSIAVLLLITGLVVYFLFKPVDFSDYMVSLAVHDALRKEPDENIYRWELDEVEELKITRQYCMGLSYDYFTDTAAAYPTMVLDLTDISMLKNLKTLEIHNTANSASNIYCLSALKECEKLESLTIEYYTLAHYNGYQHAGCHFGAKEIIDIVKSCHNLEYLNTCEPLPDFVQEEIYDINDDIELVASREHYEYINYDSDDMYEDYFDTNPTWISVTRPTKELIKDIGNQESIKTIYIYGGEWDASEDYVFDAEWLLYLPNVRNISFSGAYVTNNLEIDNIEVLEELDNVVCLSLVNCDIKDSSPIGEMENLRCLSYYDNDVPLDSDLDIYKNLSMFYSSVGVLEDCSKTLKSLKNLDKLGIAIDDMNQLDVKKSNDITYLDVRWHGEESMDMSFTEDFKNLRYLEVYGRVGGQEFDLGDMDKMPYLDTLLFLGGGFTVENPEKMAQYKNLHRLFLPLGINVRAAMDRPSGEMYQVDISDIAELEYLSFFGICTNDYVNSNIDCLEGIVGLKAMEDSGVALDIFRGKYLDTPPDNYYDYYYERYEHLN